MSPELPVSAPKAGDADRAPEVRQMFERLAPRYDLANRVLSLGLDQLWRRSAIKALGPNVRGEVIDLCAGTMDLTRMMLDAGAMKVHALDFSPSMLAAGATKLPPGANVRVETADARELPVEDHSIDGILCGFGLRNVPEVHKAVAECARVLKPGGRVVVLDFFQPESTPSRVVQASYNKLIVPVVGGLITGFGDAYRYLAGSIDAFCTRKEFEALMRNEGLIATSWDVFPPVASIVVGEAPRGGGDV